MPFFGADLWTAFELSWLNLRGKPQVALVHFTIPCETPNLIESKSFKLYLNSFNNTRLADAAEVQARLRTDLAEALWRGSEQKGDRKSTRLNSSHSQISYAVFCLKKKNKTRRARSL